MNRRVLGVAIVAALFATGCAKTLPKENPLDVSPLAISSGEERTASNIFLVTDASGTMYSNETFPKARALSESLIMALPDVNARGVTKQYNVGTIGFGGDDRVESAFQRFDRQGALETVRGLDIMGSIDGTGGTTPVADVLTEIEGKLEGTRGKTAVILFTDGLPDQPGAAIEVATRLAEERRDDICFHAIQLGDDPAGAEFLGKLTGASSCGSVRNASSIGDAYALQQFTRAAVVGPALPAVAAAPVSSNCGTIRLRGIQFGFDSANIGDEGAAVLDVAAEILSECASVGVSVEGHTDSIGSDAYNMGLSERRASSVKQFLSGQGVDASRLETEGLGESQPIAPNDTADGRARNRRVDLTPR